MPGVLLAAFGSALDELSSSIGKRGVEDGRESLYTFGFFVYFFSVLPLLLIGLISGGFFLSLTSLPTLLPRIALEILQARLSLRAVVETDRSSFSFMRTLTIPLLLAIDIALGYSFTSNQIVGIALVIFVVALFVYADHFKKANFWLLLAVAGNAALTISLYKWDISHYNSVVSEQSIVQLILALYFFVLAARRADEDPLTFLRRPRYLVQALAIGTSSAAVSFAYLFAPAAVITAALRASSVLFATLSGRFYFRETRFMLKFFLVIGIGLGLTLLVM